MPIFNNLGTGSIAASGPRQHPYGESLLPDNTILNRVYDASTDTLSINLASGSINLTASLGSVKVEDGLNATQKLAVLADGSINVNVVLSGLTDSIALTDPTGTLIIPAQNQPLIDIRDTAGIKKIQDPVTIIVPTVASASVPDGAVTVGVSSVTALALNSSRMMATFINDSDTVIYLALGPTASLNAGIRLNAHGGSFEITMINRYTGVVSAISTIASKNLCVTEA
jgi:hypothetical protein